MKGEATWASEFGLLEANCIVSLMDRLVQIGMRRINFFEPFAKYGISYYLKGELKKLEQQGLISGYTLKATRLNKWHYKIYLDLDVTAKQLAYILTKNAQQIRKLLRR